VSLTENVKVIADAVSDLGPPFQGKPRVASIVFAFAYQLQELESVIFDVLSERTLTAASDAQLRTLGEIVGEPRYDRTDEEYRIAILGRILANRSRGRRETLLRLFELMRPGVSYYFVEGKASIEIQSESTDHDLDRVVLEFLNDARAGGVSLTMTAPADADAEFTFGPYGVPTSDDDTGFSSTTETTLGGKLRFAL